MKENIASLGETIAKTSVPTAKLPVTAAAVDTTALIHGTGKTWVAKIKAGMTK